MARLSIGHSGASHLAGPMLVFSRALVYSSAMPTSLDTLVSLLDRTLDVAAFHDASNNGLQLANSGTVEGASVQATNRGVIQMVAEGRPTVILIPILFFGS